MYFYSGPVTVLAPGAATSHLTFALTDSSVRLSRTRLLPRFVESVGDHRASLGDVGSGRGEAFEQSSIAFPGETPLTAATGRPIPDAAQLFVEGAKSIQVARQAVVRSARATRSPASDGSCCKLLRVSTLLAFHEALEVARAPSLAQLAQRLGLYLTNTFARDGELLADLFEGAVGLLADAEAHAQDLLFAWRQRRQYLARLLAQVAADRRLDRRCA